MILSLKIYNTLRKMGVKPALAYRLAYMEAPTTPTEFTLMLTARRGVI